MRGLRRLVATIMVITLSGSSLLLSGCSVLRIERETGSRLGIVEGTRGSGIYQGERVQRLAEQLTPYGAVATKMARLDPGLIFVYAVTYDGCSRTDPRLKSSGDNLTVTYDELDRACEAPIPQTVFFALEWADLPDEFFLGTDPDDPGRTRVVDREVRQPRLFALRALTRSEQPAVEKTTFQVARTAAEMKKALAADDIDLKRETPKAGQHLLVVVRTPTCKTSPSLSMLDARMAYYATELDNDDNCGEHTVETAAFIVARKGLPKSFTLGPGDEASDEDITVTLA